MIITVTRNPDSVKRFGDFTELMTQYETITMYSEYGVLLFTQELTREPGVYNITLYVEPDGRGAWGRDFIDKCFDKMFNEYDAIELQGGIHNSNTACLKMLSIINHKAEITQKYGFTRCVFT